MAQRTGQRTNRGITVSVKIDGLRETLDAFKQLPKDASDALRARSLELAETLAQRAAAAARAEGHQAGAMAPTVKAKRDRVPVVEAGGTKKVGRHKTSAYQLLFGSEFGQSRRTGWYGRPRYAGSAGRQYKPHRGRRGYWFFPTVERHEAEIAAAWQKAADDVVTKFGGA